MIVLDKLCNGGAMRLVVHLSALGGGGVVILLGLFYSPAKMYLKGGH